MISLGTCRQAARGITGDIYDVKGKGTIKSRSIPAIDINAELYLSMLNKRVQENSWSQQCKPRRVEAASGISIELPRPQARNEVISGPEGILHKGASHSGALAQNRNRYRDPVILGYYGSGSRNIHYSRPLPAPASRPDPMLIS